MKLPQVMKLSTLYHLIALSPLTLHLKKQQKNPNKIELTDVVAEIKQC